MKRAEIIYPYRLAAGIVGATSGSYWIGFTLSRFSIHEAYVLRVSTFLD